MQRKNIENLQHSHSFGHDAKRPGEVRTFIVIAITASMMILEIATGIAFGSMALLADGLHMGSHAVALAINAFAYIYARRHAKNQRFSFGTGKVNTLGGYTGAILLAVFSASWSSKASQDYSTLSTSLSIKQFWSQPSDCSSMVLPCSYLTLNIHMTITHMLTMAMQITTTTT